MNLYNCILWALLLELVQAAPLSDDSVVVDDMIFSRSQYEYMKGNPSFRNAMQDQDLYWPNSTVLYRFGQGLYNYDKRRIRSAMEVIAFKSCVRFREDNNPKEHHVVIERKSAACAATLGYRVNVKDQSVNLGRGCMSIGRIQHELLHTLGFVHMQCDPKRDRYIDIKYENIQPGNIHNFEVFENTHDFNVGYDYASVLHYGPKQFSVNNRRTIVPKQHGVQIGQRSGLSEKDILKLNIIYCKDKVNVLTN